MDQQLKRAVWLEPETDTMHNDLNVVADEVIC